MRICFLGVENKSIEELGDFRETLYEQIDQRILHSGNFQSVSKRYVDAGLQAANLRPDEVLIPQNMRILTERMEQMQQPFDFVLIAKVTSGTTRSNANYEREYLLTLGNAQRPQRQLRQGIGHDRQEVQRLDVGEDEEPDSLGMIDSKPVILLPCVAMRHFAC